MMKDSVDVVMVLIRGDMIGIKQAHTHEYKRVVTHAMHALVWW